VNMEPPLSTLSFPWFSEESEYDEIHKGMFRVYYSTHYNRKCSSKASSKASSNGASSGTGPDSLSRVARAIYNKKLDKWKDQNPGLPLSPTLLTLTPRQIKSFECQARASTQAALQYVKKVGMGDLLLQCLCGFVFEDFVAAFNEASRHVHYERSKCCFKVFECSGHGDELKDAFHTLVVVGSLNKACRCVYFILSASTSELASVFVC
jgi:hypothetical protein